jgi:hypothetical protein
MKGLLYKTIVKTFYRRHAGFFLFFFLVFFGVVAPSEQPAYHYALIRGMLEAPVFLGLVGLAWLLYAFKCVRYVMDILRSPEHVFLYKLSELEGRRLFGLVLRVQGWLFLPVWAYSLAITGVAGYQGRFVTATGVQLLVVMICLVSAGCYYYRLRSPEKAPGWGLFGWAGDGRNRIAGADRSGRKRARKVASPYWFWLLRYLFQDHKFLLAGIKLSGCCLLYLLLKEQGPDDYDLRMPFLLYSLVLFGHGLLIYRCRELEEKRLLFYRSLPVPRVRRFMQYAFFYGTVLVPEMLTLGWLTPHPIHFIDTLGFILAGYSMLLLLNSLLFVANWRIGDFLKLSAGIFGILYFGVLGGVLIAMSGFFFVTAFVLFFRSYYRYEVR